MIVVINYIDCIKDNGCYLFSDTIERDSYVYLSDIIHISDRPYAR